MKWFKFLSTLVIISMVAVFALPTFAVKAQAALPPQCTGFQLENASSTATASVSIGFYKVGNTTGTPEYTFNLGTLAARKSLSYYMPSYSGFSTMTPGSYSAVVSSDAPLNTLVNQISCAGAAWGVLGSSNGVSEVATDVYLPWVNSRAYGAANWNSLIAVQNAGSAAAAFTVDFLKPGVAAPVATFTPTIQVGGSWTMDTSTDTTAALANFAGGVHIHSTQFIAAVATLVPGSGKQLFVYNGYPSTWADTTLFVPQLNKNYGGYNSGLTIFNPNSTATPISISYIPSGSSTPTYVQTAVVAANNVFTQYVGAIPVTSLPDNFNGTAIVKVTSGANPLLGIANLTNSLNGGTVNMVPLSQASTELHMPQVVHNPVTTNIQSGLQIVNTSSTSTITVHIEFWNSTDTTTPTYAYDITLAPNQPYTRYVGSMPISQVPVPFNGGVIFKVTAGTGKLVGQSNFVDFRSTSSDGLSIYNAFPILP